MVAPQVAIGLLGPFELLCDGRPVVLRGTRDRRLLAFMALNAGTEVPVESIVDLLWLDAPDSARQQVHNVVSHLRRSIAAVGCREIELVTGTVGYRLEVPRAAVDAFRFETAVQQAEQAHAGDRPEEAVRLLREGVDLWRGPALAALTGDGLEAAATRLNGMRLTALERIAEIQMRLGDPHTPIRDLPGLLAEHPYQESLRALLMRALSRAGRQADALALYESGRVLLAEELGVGPGVLLRRTHQQILRGRDQPTALPDTSAEPAAAPAAPPVAAGRDRRADRSFLPRGIAEFLGRDTELAWLTAELDRHGSDAPAVVVVDGMGGVGKTTFVTHLAHRIADRFPDGQYYIDLMGFSAGTQPLSSLAALGALLKADGVPPEAVPTGLEERSALWRSRLVGRRLLVFLDNAAEVGQIRTLLPGSPGTLTLISTRRQMISLEGAVHLSLGVLAEDAAVELFTRIAGAERVAGQADEVRTAVGLCGHLPLAIQIAAARLRARANWPVSYLASHLLSLRGRTLLLASGDRDVMSILSWSFRHLTQVQQRGFRALGQHAGPDVDVHVIAALAGLSVEEAENCADGLMEANLLQQHRPGRFYFHDLVRDCARIQLGESWTDDERAESVHRLVEYFLHSANQWSITTSGSLPRIDLGPGGPPAVFKEAIDHAAAVSMFDADVPNIGATVRLAGEFGLHSRIWRLVYVLMPYFHGQNYTGDSAELLQVALDAARESGSREGESLCLTGLAMLRRSENRLGESRGLLLAALDLSRADGLAGAEIWQWVNLGAVCLAENDHAEARRCYLRGVRVAQLIGDKHSEAYCTTNIGNLLLEAGELTEALEHFRGVEWLGLDTLPPRLGTSVLLNIGFTLLLQESDVEAVGYFEAALAASRATGDPGNEVYARIDLAAARRILGDLDESFHQGRAGLELAQSLRMQDLEIDARSALADVHLAGGDLPAAERIYRTVHELAVQQGQARYLARAHEGLAHLHAARGDRDAAREYWSRSLDPHPGGVVHADGARAHRDASDCPACWRCRSRG